MLCNRKPEPKFQAPANQNRLGSGSGSPLRLHSPAGIADTRRGCAKYEYIEALLLNVEK